MSNITPDSVIFVDDRFAEPTWTDQWLTADDHKGRHSA